MWSIVLDTTYVFMCSYIVDTSVDAFTGVFVGEVVSKITVSSLIYFLVVAMPWPTVAASVPTTVVMTSCPATAIV